METRSIRRLACDVLVAAFLFSFLVFARAQTPPPSQPAPTVYRVAGTVVSSIDGRVLPRALVILTSATNPALKDTARSGEDGRFQFTRVPKGRYSLEGAKRGFIPQAYNQHEQYSTAIVTGADLPTEDLVLRLPPAAIVSVKVFDESAEPVRNGQVMLYQEDRSTGVRRIFAKKGGGTNDLGVCELARLDPGTYFLAVNYTPWYALHPTSAREGGQNTPLSDMRAFDVTYPATYYGDTTEPDSATPIVVKGGEKVQAEIHLSPVSALHLIFHSADDGQHGMVMPMLQRVGLDANSSSQGTEIRNLSKGEYEITGIAPGRYIVTSPGSTPTEMNLVNNDQDLSESKGEPLSTLKVTVQPMGDLKLQEPLYIRLSDSAQKNPDAGQQILEGKATFSDVRPGQYNLFAGSRTKAYPVVKVITPAGETSGHSIRVASGTTVTATVMLSGDLVNVTGFAKRNGRAASGVMVVLVPKHPESNREIFRRDQSDLDGSFNLQGVLPGAYTIVAIENGWDMDWASPDVIAPYLKNGQTISIGNNSEKSVELKEAIVVQPHA